MKIAVLLHGNGVYDGTEIQEAVLCLLHLNQLGMDYQCVAPNVFQHHVINHLNGDEMPEARNVWVESARIARGNCLNLAEVNPEDYHGLVMPGGFGTAKNITQWAFAGPDGGIHEPTAQFIRAFVQSNKPIAALCMSPTTLAKALEGALYHPVLSVGTNAKASPYDISAISQGIEQTGAKSTMKSVNEIEVDEELKIISAPCYMMEASIGEVSKNIQQALEALKRLATA